MSVRAEIASIVSGGQTGPDRAALDFAIANDLAYEGWCPRGGWAEDLPDPPGLIARYPRLRETPSADPQQRTRWNVRDSAATLIIVPPGGRVISPGTDFTRQVAVELSRGLAVVDVAEPMLARAALDALIASAIGPTVLNVAGPRESQAPGIYAAARRLLDELLLS